MVGAQCGSATTTVGSPVPSLPFLIGAGLSDLLGMTLLRTSHHGDFSLYFLAHLGPEEVEQFSQLGGESGGGEFIARRFGPVLELTHNHGTENDPEFK